MPEMKAYGAKGAKGSKGGRGGARPTMAKAGGGSKKKGK
jgi:hypothetical protein